jgi:hypothetical protein
MNTIENIHRINHQNDAAQTLGDETQQKVLINDVSSGTSISYSDFREDNSIFPEIYDTEWKEFQAEDEDEDEIIARHEVKNKIVRQPKNEIKRRSEMTDIKKSDVVVQKTFHDDVVCKFYISSLTVVGLYIIFKFMQKSRG